MTTARTLIQSSLRLLRVIAEGESMTAEQAQDGLQVMNDMLHGLEAEGVYLGYADIGLDDDLPLPRKHIKPVRFLLAVDLAAEFASTLTPEVSVTAQDSKKILQAAYRRVGRLTTDPALRDRTDRGYDAWSIENNG